MVDSYVNRCLLCSVTQLFWGIWMNMSRGLLKLCVYISSAYIKGWVNTNVGLNKKRWHTVCWCMDVWVFINSVGVYCYRDICCWLILLYIVYVYMLFVMIVSCLVFCCMWISKEEDVYAGLEFLASSNDVLFIRLYIILFLKNA